MARTLKEIAQLVDGEIVGDEKIKITGVAGIEDAGEGDITFLANPKYINYLEKTNASAVIASRGISSAVKPLVLTDNPSLAFTKVVSFIMPQEDAGFSGIHKTALIGENVKLGKNVALGPYVVIEDNVSIGDNTLIYSHCFVGKRSAIGSDAIIYPNVSIRENTQIKDRVIIHSGTVIGSDGFGFVTVEKKHHKIPQVGTVVIENDVEIGANVTIDRARFDKTVIGEGTKIDNLVQIAHNVTIGKNCLIVAQVGISGSTKIGDNVILAGQAGLAGHITIGDNSIVMAQAGVAKSLPSGSVVWGTPARPADEVKRSMAAVLNLPKLMETIKELKKKIEGKND